MPDQPRRPRTLNDARTEAENVFKKGTTKPVVPVVTIGPELQEKAVETYGVRDVEDLANQLRKDVERELGRSGAYDGARIELTLVDAAPNRPTFKQLSDTPGLSLASFGLGGAKIEGQAIAPGGA